MNRWSLIFKCIVIAALFLAVLRAPVFAQAAGDSTTNRPILLCGFEGPDAAQTLKGLKCTVTSSHVSEGAQAISFTIPSYQPGGNEWPAVMLDSNAGKGYSVTDWSHCARFAFDAWIEGNVQGDLSVELSDGSKQPGFSRGCLVMPGQKNRIEIDLSGVKTVDLKNVRRITFFTGRQSRDYTITIDNLRLLPSNRPPFAEYNLVYPNYRGLIFPSVKNIKVTANIQAREYHVDPTDLIFRVTAVSANHEIHSASSVNTYQPFDMLDTSELPNGPIQLTASINNAKDNKQLSSQTWALRKISRAEVDSLKVYIDENNNTIADGKPFFPIGWYNNTSDECLDEIGGDPFNCILDYGTNNVPKDTMLKYLDRVQQKGMKIIYCMNDLYPTATYMKDKSWEGITGNENITPAVVNAYKNHPAILAWYLNDELPRTLEPALEGYYQKVVDTDPTHPCYVVLCEMSEVKYFPATTDIMGVDLYPVPSQPLTLVSDEAETATSAVHGHKPIWIVPQAFAWYQYGTNPDRGHTPTAEELKQGRAPTFDETRCMTYLALTHGAKGLIYYCYYDLRLLPQHKEMWDWMKKIGLEAKTLSPILLSPDDFGTVPCAPASAHIHTKLKRYNGRLYLMAVNPDRTPCKVKFNIQHRIAGQADVMFEARSVKSNGHYLTDTFKPMEAHVYDLGVY